MIAVPFVVPLPRSAGGASSQRLAVQLVLRVKG